MFEKILAKLKALFDVKDLSDAEMTAELDALNKDRHLAWKSSVVDFLELIGVDSSRANRDALAKDLNISKDLPSGSAEFNEALRKALFKSLANNGGDVPSSLTD